MLFDHGKRGADFDGFFALDANGARFCAARFGNVFSFGTGNWNGSGITRFTVPRRDGRSLFDISKHSALWVIFSYEGKRNKSEDFSKLQEPVCSEKTKPNAIRFYVKKGAGLRNEPEACG